VTGTVEAAWADFHDRMKAVGELITGDAFPDDSRMRAEGFRYLNRLSMFAQQLYLEFSDPARPAFMRFGDDVLKWGATNVDNNYLRAHVTDAFVYRVTGTTTGLREVIISTHEGEFALGKTAVVGELTLEDLELEADGAFELIVGGDERASNWLPIDGDEGYLQFREFVADWEHDAIADLSIEVIDGDVAPPAPPTDELVAQQLDRAARWVEASAPLWNTYSTAMRDTMPVNATTPPRRAEGAAENMLTGGAYWRFARDEALVIEFDVPQATYWSYQVYSIGWFEPPDAANRVTSLNDQQAHIDDDGRCRVVLAHEDPGVQNWIDTWGYADGLVTYRWVRPTTAPTPVSKLVKVDAVRDHLPATTPQFSPDDRRAQIAQRRRGIARRFRR
jgi:hypothetical protein